MAVSNDFVAYVVEQLAPLGRVTSRRLFGGVGLYADDLFFALIDDDTLFFKVDDSNRGEYERRGSKPFCPFKDKSEFTMGYYDVPADLLDDAEELSRWARKSVAVALVAASKKTKRPKTKTATMKKTGSRKAASKKATKQKAVKKSRERR